MSQIAGVNQIAFEFRLAQVRHPDDPDKRAQFWMMEMVGKIGGIGHCIRSLPLATYPPNRTIAAFFSRSTRALRDWFASAEYAAAKERAAKPNLLVLPGRG